MLLASLGAFMVPALALWLPSGYSWGAILLLLLALATSWQWLRAKPDAATLALAATMILMALMWGVQADPALGSARWDRVTKYVLAIPCLLMLAVYAPRPGALVWGVCVGSLGALGVAWWQITQAQLPRASGYTNAIQFGNLALLLGIMAGTFAFVCYRRLNKWLALALLAATGAGVAASLLSHTRGGWLAFFLLLPFSLLLLRGKGKKVGAVFAGSILMLVLLGSWGGASVIEERARMFNSDMAHYAQGRANTSVGHRLEHWRMAWQMGRERPLVGWGDQGYKAHRAELVRQGAYHPVVLDYDHAHNEFLDLFAKRGLAGLLALGLFYVVPIYIFWPSRRRMQVFNGAATDLAEMALALRFVGLSIPLCYIGFGLTQVFFAHNSGTMFYLFMVMLVWAALKGVLARAHAVQAQFAGFAQPVESAALEAGLPIGAGHGPKMVSAGGAIAAVGTADLDADAGIARLAPPRAGGKPRVLHFVTGGFSGATQVAVDLVRAHRQTGVFEPLLVLRKKFQTRPERIELLQREQMPLMLVSGWPHDATIAQLAVICQQWKPDIVVAHGFSEHIWGRYAALKAAVPHMVHVEHNSRERYTPKRLQQSLWLAERTDRIVGCSEGVKNSLLKLGFPAQKVMAISNGIRLEPFAAAGERAFALREPGIVMAARFARQKDHTTLLQALALLRQRGLAPKVYLAGGGKKPYRRAAERLAARLGLGQQVQFLGFYNDVPALLMRNQICVLSSHYEGMPLSLIEGMAAGCAVVGSRVPGIEEVIAHEQNGLLTEHANAASLADAFERLLRNPDEAAKLAEQARSDAVQRYSLEQMIAQYEALFVRLLQGAAPAGNDKGRA